MESKVKRIPVEFIKTCAIATADPKYQNEFSKLIFMLCLFDEVLSTLNKGGTVLPSWNSVQYYYSLIGKSKNFIALDVYKIAV